MFHPFSPDDGDVSGLRPGFKFRTKWSFQRRWMPRDMKSFMESYDEATEEKTAPTIYN
jgi:hypothetical protein